MFANRVLNTMSSGGRRCGMHWQNGNGGGKEIIRGIPFDIFIPGGGRYLRIYLPFPGTDPNTTFKYRYLANDPQKPFAVYRNGERICDICGIRGSNFLRFDAIRNYVDDWYFPCVRFAQVSNFVRVYETHYYGGGADRIDDPIIVDWLNPSLNPSSPLYQPVKNYYGEVETEQSPMQVRKVATCKLSIKGEELSTGSIKTLNFSDVLIFAEMVRMY